MRTDIIEELQQLEHCTTCYIHKRAEALITPWLECRYPWEEEFPLNLEPS